jgi:predicted RNA-binding Zn-ribbon protein involved in translation (DUF1610 family)
VDPCPDCGNTEALRRSRPRSFAERIRRRFTGRIPVRCHACGWRGWRHDDIDQQPGHRGVHRELTESELERLDPEQR